MRTCCKCQVDAHRTTAVPASVPELVCGKQNYVIIRIEDADISREAGNIMCNLSADDIDLMLDYMLDDVMALRQKLRLCVNRDICTLFGLILLAWYQYRVCKQTRRRIGNRL